MLAKDSHLGGQTWRRMQSIPSSVVSNIPGSSTSVLTNIPAKRGFSELHNQYVRNQVEFTKNWRNYPDMVFARDWIKVKILEFIIPVYPNALQLVHPVESLLFSCAASKEEYMNLDTLHQRVQGVVDASKSYGSAGYYGVSNVGQFQPSIAHYPPYLLDYGSPVPPLAEMDVNHNFPVFGDGSSFPQQHANNVEMDLTKPINYLGKESINFPTTMGKSLESGNLNLKFSQFVSVDNSEHSNCFPSMMPSLKLETTWQNQNMMDSDFGVSSINEPWSDQKNYEMVQPYSSQTLSTVHQQSEFRLPSIHNETSMMVDTFGLGEIFTKKPFLSKGLEGCQILELPKSSNNFTSDGNIEAMLQPAKRQKLMEPNQEKQAKSSNTNVGSLKKDVIVIDDDNDIEVSEPKVDQEKQTKLSNTAVGTLRQDVIVIDDDDDIDVIPGFNHEGINARYELGESKSDQEMNINVLVDTYEQTFKTEIFPTKGLEADQISVDPCLESHGVIDSRESMEVDIGSNSNMHTLTGKVPFPIDAEVIHDITGYNQEGTNSKNKVCVPKSDQEQQIKSSNKIVNAVSSTDFFTSDQLKEHISSLRNYYEQIPTEEETVMDPDTCQLCKRQKLYFKPVPIICFFCGKAIKKSKIYFCSKEEGYAQHCFCSACHMNIKGGKIKLIGTSVSMENLEMKKNDEVVEEPWVACDKCKRWQHQVCALYNNQRDLDRSADYICPVCRLKEIENGMHVPLPKTATFGAKDLPRTMLSDHLEKRLFKKLMQERADYWKGKEKIDEVSAAETLSVREVLSVDKQLKVKKEFLDIIPKEKYPTEVSYKSRAILLFQHIEGVDVCIFSMYVQEFGSECGHPNQRCVYISYLDSVKYFRPDRATKSGGALRTFVYHEILIGYLDFCKKRGFSTCYIWSCPPLGGDDYILYSHPDDQKIPKTEKLRSWYFSMLKKAIKENVVVDLTNIHDHFFFPTEKSDSKVTAAHFPYFDGAYWCDTAIEQARKIGKRCGGNYEKMLKVVSNRFLKGMGNVNPSKDTALDILVMQRLDTIIFPNKDNFMIAHLQYSCMHCREVIVSGKRWFCTKCKKFQECERCHSSDVHTSKKGEVHNLCQVLVDDVPVDTKLQNDIILENELFENRNNFLCFCQHYQFQFDTLRRAKYTSMMILYHLSKDRGADCHEHKLTQNDSSADCHTHKLIQNDTTAPGADCHEHKLTENDSTALGAECHEHKLTQNGSTAASLSENQEMVQMLKLMDALKHASRCESTIAKPCSYPECRLLKKLLSHGTRCETKASGGCQPCKKMWHLLKTHSMICEDSEECTVPRCRDMKKHLQNVETSL